MMQKVNNKLIVILGPTASGKSDLAIRLAKKFNGEIVCADSRQIYKGMTIGTAKTSETRSRNPRPGLGVPHHLFDIALPNKPLNVAIYKKMAEKTIKDIQKRGKVPFLVGGTGLYIKAIVDNLQFPKLKPNQKLRKKLEQKTTKELFIIYKKLDGQGAKQIDNNNKRRLIRAIEVCKITGQPFWEQRQKATPLFDVSQIGIKFPKAELKKRIGKRTNKMLKQGLEREVKLLVKKYGWTAVLQNTIGYAEWQKKTTKKKLRELIFLHTIQFAKRQMTWFKKEKRIKWINNPAQAKKLIIDFLD
ncbi:MAG: tRNA (adenosine(37)-N6)-dimethylallyltransferase MiaA [Candidatus Pacebacteria bacterium]|nr:tRNA (adenosine(37)-N6)-dimethylallyltransferase MiaA [Candidatus Paceibacterota bacterium]